MIKDHITIISSRQNPRIRELSALRRGQRRKETGLSLAEGIRLTKEALHYGKTETLILSEQLAGTTVGEELADLAGRRGVEILRISESCYAKISRLENPEGAAAVVRVPRIEITQLLTPACRLVVAAGLQDPGNAGAIARAAEAAGASGCIFLEGIDPGHPRFLRGAAGSAFRLPCAAGEISAFLKAARKIPVRILATTLAAGSLPYHRADFTPPVAICLGGEGKGLPEEIFQGADQLITIPMADPVESLNAAVAAGIILYGAGWNCP